MSARSTLLSVLTSLGVLLIGAASALAGEGPAPQLGQASLAPAPAELRFGAVDIHFGGSPQQSITLSNETLTAATVMSATVSGPDASHFEIDNDSCVSETLEPGNMCTVEIRFQPGIQGEEHATLTVELLGGEGALEVPLSGSGSTGTLSSTPSLLSFSGIPYTHGEHEENQSETEQVNIESHQAGVQIESVSIVGADASSFSIQYGDCVSDQLAPGNWCDAGVRFQPLSPGEKHAELLITSDSPDSPLIVPLEGDGLLGPTISLDSNEALLGDVSIGSSASHAFTIANSGDYPLFIQQSFLVSGTPRMFPVLSNTCTGQIVMPGDSCEIAVGFEPATTGEKDASMIFITNTTPQINVLGIDGVGVQLATAPTSPSQSATPAATGSDSQAPVATPPPAPSPTHKRKRATALHLLMFEQASRLYSSIGKIVVDTGVNAQCPVGVGSCRTESFIVAHVLSSPLNATAQRAGHAIVLLGSQTARLHGGENASVSIPLSSRAVTLLRQNGHLRATIDLVIHAAGKIIVERARMVTLTAAESG